MQVWNAECREKNAKIIFIIVLLSILLFVALVTFIPMITTPIRRPLYLVRSYVLKQTPIGTDIEDVIAVIESRDDWSAATVIEGGLITRPIGKPSVVVGEVSVVANLGRFHAWYVMFGVPSVSTSAQWDFDEDGRLIDVFIRQGGLHSGW